ncbi:MAG: C4-dicarboxylic acid transporter DauA [Bdellovibrionales bacterium]|nr:C4-dicarboxylic acid transporter DauA [Bdellovibrionales bacterium]
MSKRYQSDRRESKLKFHTHLLTAVKQTLKEGYTRKDLISDLLSGSVVALVAIPLAMALAIASGVAPQYGLYTVIFGGAIIALLGGSRLQVSGPTAAFVVILYPIVQKFGFSGLLISGFLAGIILIIMGYSHLGRLIQFIPYPVTTGFTSGIAVVIAVLQIKDFFGLNVKTLPESFFAKVEVLMGSISTFSFIEFGIGLVTLFLLITWPKLNKKIPAPLAALSFVTVICVILNKLIPGFEIASIGSRFTSGIPQSLPEFNWPWQQVGTGSIVTPFTLESIRLLLPSAFAIAMLGAIESLLSAVVADGMAQTKHDPDGELIALGIGNLICPFFGGIPATGAIARTTTNIRYGAKSPFSSVFHAFFTLLTVLLFAPYISYLPMAALAALLLVVAYNMSEYKHFIHILKVAPRSDVSVLLICFTLTVVFDMVVGVTVGVGLASLLFIKRMADVTEGHSLTNNSEFSFDIPNLPSNVVIYEIEGALFFGAAEKAAEALTHITDEVKSVVLLLQRVPVMDVTGLVALEGAIRKLNKAEKEIYLVGLQRQPQLLVNKSLSKLKFEKVYICQNLDEALQKLKL